MNHDIAWADLHQQMQENLVNFLTVEIELAGTLYDRAKTHPQRRAEILGKIKQAIDTVRRFADRIDDPATRKSFFDRAGDLECRVEK
jgi:hypothetical protein